MPKKSVHNKKTVDERQSKKSSAIEVEGKVLEVVPGYQFRVELPNKHTVTALGSGKFRLYDIRILPGDTVTLELSEYDLTRGRITYRK